MAMAQNNLGNALKTLGERQSGTARLEQAVAAYRNALLERTRERVPLDWATTQNNLGLTLVTLGVRESGTVELEQVVALYRNILLEYTHEREPLERAKAQANLGIALAMLGERSKDAGALLEALAAIEGARVILVEGAGEKQYAWLFDKQPAEKAKLAALNGQGSD